MFRNARCTVFLLSFLFLSFLATPAAQAVQTGGSISLYPTDWGLLKTGEIIDVQVVVNNTSSDTPASIAPGDGVDPVPAKLTGAITVLLGCVDCECENPVTGKLKFVPVGATGCVDKDGNTMACQAAGNDAVLITLKPNGIALPANGSVDVATIRIEVVNGDDITGLGMRALTDACALHACSSSVPSVCADCDATGCTTLRFGQPNFRPCPHDCPGRIIFRGGAEDPDFFEFHVLIEPGPIDPVNETFTLSLKNSGPIFSFSLPPGSFTAQGKTFNYRNQSARENGGIAFVKIAERSGEPGVFKIDIQAFDADLESLATEALMTVDFAIGNDPFSITDTWTQKPNGWILNLGQP